MAGFYTKLDNGITDSTIWQELDTTRLVWITLLALADQNGYVGASMPGLAGRARVALEDCIAAVECLSAPDKWSRTKENEGRRIAEADGGWVLLNHGKYRAMQNADDRRERSRLAMQRLRASQKAATGLTVNTGDQSLTMLAQAEAEATTEEKEKGSAVAPSASLAPPPAFDGNNAEEIRKGAVIPLAAAFELSEEWGIDAEALGFPRPRILIESEKFRQYWTAGNGAGKRKSLRGWRQAWSNWLGKAAERVA